MHPPKTPPTQLRSQGLRASSATCRTSAECGPIGPTGPWKLAHRRKRATAVHRGDPILSVPHSEPPPSVRTCPAVCPARTAQRPMRTPVCPARHARHAHLTVCPAPPTESSVRPAVCPARHFATRAPCVSQAPPRAPCAPPRAPRGTSQRAPREPRKPRRVPSAPRRVPRPPSHVPRAPRRVPQPAEHALPCNRRSADFAGAPQPTLLRPIAPSPPLTLCTTHPCRRPLRPAVIVRCCALPCAAVCYRVLPCATVCCRLPNPSRGPHCWLP